MTVWPTRKGVSMDGVHRCISPWLGRTQMHPSCDDWTLSWTRVGDAGWRLVVSPGRGPPTSESQNIGPERLRCSTCYRQTDRRMDGWSLARPAACTTSEQDGGSTPSGPPGRGQRPRTSFFQASVPFVHPESCVRPQMGIDECKILLWSLGWGLQSPTCLGVPRPPEPGPEPQR